MEYRVRGADRQTGEDREILVHAAGAAEAREWAGKLGLYVASAEAVPPPRRRAATAATAGFRAAVLAALVWCGWSLHSIASRGVRVPEGVEVQNLPTLQRVRVVGEVDVDWPAWGVDVNLD